MARPGWVYFVGAGPGDPALLTARGRALLGSADVVLHDGGSGAEVLRELLGELQAGVEVCLLPISEPAAVSSAAVSSAEGEPPTGSAAADRLLDEARAGRRVVRLLGGDGLSSGCGSSEAAILAEEGVPFQLVPGISWPAAAAAYAGAPINAQLGEVNMWGYRMLDLVAADTEAALAILRVKPLIDQTLGVCLRLRVEQLKPLASLLLAELAFEATMAALVIEHVCSPQQRCRQVTLSALANRASNRDAAGPCLLVIGPHLEKTPVSWFQEQPLFGKRVLVTRPEHQAAPTAQLLRERGAEPVLFPTIAIEAPPDPALVEQAVSDLHGYDLVVFTSENGVRWFWREIDRQGKDARVFAAAKVAAIGPATKAALREHGIEADIMADTFVAESLAEAIEAFFTGARPRVLLPRALVAREILPEMLRASGMHVEVVPVYQTVTGSSERRAGFVAILESIDVVILTSSSTVEQLCGLLGEQAVERLAGKLIASIGPITTATAQRLGLTVGVSASRSTGPGLVDALEAALR